MEVVTQENANRPVEFDKDGRPVVSSLHVSEVFGKRHWVVMRALESLDMSEKFRDTNYVFSQYKTAGNNRTYPICFMTRDGFWALAMQFTGPEAALKREEMIGVLNAAEEAFRNPNKLLDSMAPADKVEMLAKVVADELRAQEARADAAQSAFEGLQSQQRALIEDSTNKVQGEIDRRHRAERERDVYKAAIEKTTKVAYRFLSEAEDQLESMQNDLLAKSEAENITQLPVKSPAHRDK